MHNMNFFFEKMTGGTMGLLKLCCRRSGRHGRREMCGKNWGKRKCPTAMRILRWHGIVGPRVMAPTAEVQ